MARSVTVGNVELHFCNLEYGGYCGRIERAIDPTGAAAGTVKVAFEWYPHTAGTESSAGVIVAEEGGPGYSTTGSRDGYLRVFAPLRSRRDILLVDKRGSGRSGAIDCPALQLLPDPRLVAVAACAQQLGPAAWLYGTDLAVDDLAAVLDALGISSVDYYGDSYGTFFGEVFAARHPSKLRTLVLDSAYPVSGQTPWYASEIENGSASLNPVCARSVSCARLGGSSLERFDQLLDSLRTAPITGSAPDAGGRLTLVTADAEGLLQVIYNAGNSPTAYRDLDAAARALQQKNDPLPLLRLVAEAGGGADSGNERVTRSGLSGWSARSYSYGLYDAVACSDYPQLFDLTAADAERIRQLLQSIAGQAISDPDLYAPFTLKDVTTAPADPESFYTCLAWPSPPSWIVPGQPVAPGTRLPPVPTLVLSGELDTVTSPQEGMATAALFPRARFLLVPNGIHETAIGDAGNWVPPNGADLSECVAPIVLAFIDSGGDPGDTSCLAQIRPIRTVPLFTRSYRELPAADALPGNEVEQSGRRLASAVLEAVGDSVARYFVSLSGTGAGLRGGQWMLKATPSGYDFALHRVHWTEDVSVSGIVHWNQQSGAIDSSVKFRAPGHRGRLRAEWNDRVTAATAIMNGVIDGRTLAATRIAP